jgi:hypothetical protein
MTFGHNWVTEPKVVAAREEAVNLAEAPPIADYLSYSPSGPDVGESTPAIPPEPGPLV